MSGFAAPPHKYAEPLENRRVFAGDPRVNWQVLARLRLFWAATGHEGSKSNVGTAKTTVAKTLAIPGGLEPPTS